MDIISFSAAQKALARSVRLQKKRRPIALRSNHLGNSTFLSAAGHSAGLYRTQHVLINDVQSTGIQLEYANVTLTPGYGIKIAAAFDYNSKAYPMTFGGGQPFAALMAKGVGSIYTDPFEGVLIDQNEFSHIDVWTLVTAIQPSALGTGGALTAGTPVTSLTVTALTAAAPVGATITITSGFAKQNFVLATAAASGATSLTVPSTTPLFSFPVGSIISVEGGQWPVGLFLNNVNGEGVTFDATTTGILSAGASVPSPPTVAGTGTGAFSPVAILGFNSTPSSCVGIVGDSIAIGTGDVGTSFGSMDTALDNGWVMRLLNRQVPYVWYSKYADTASVMALNQHWRSGPLEHMTVMLDELGINDFVSLSHTAAQVANDKLSLARQASVRGLPLYWTTISPVTTSTDLWATTGNQTKFANDSARVTFNDWLRAGAPIVQSGGLWVYTAVGTGGATVIGQSGHPVTGYFDVANAIESATDSGLWKTAERTVTDAAMSSSTNPSFLTSATAAFTSGDIGKQVLVAGASAASATLIGIINSINSATVAVLSQVASTTVTAARATINPYTVDGTHPTGVGHAAAAAACTQSKLIVPG